METQGWSLRLRALTQTQPFYNQRLAPIKILQKHLRPGVAEQRKALVSAKGGTVSAKAGKAPVSDDWGFCVLFEIFLTSGAFGYTT